MNNAKLSKVWDALGSSYWFVPTLMAGGAIALAFGIVTLDQSGKAGPIEKLGWIYAGGPDGARTVLSTIAGSMITVAGTAFSIVIVALQLASSQFGPRLLRNFMQDRGNQVVLGTFIATFIYCLLVLRTVRGDDYGVFVPQIAVTVGILLAIASIGVLIYFIHHASVSIQVWKVIQGVSHDLNKSIEQLFPEPIGHGISQKRRWVEEIPVNFEQESASIVATHSGYLQVINDEQLMQIARSQNLLLRLKYRPGQFVVENTELAFVWPGEHANQKLTQQINDAFVLGMQRTEDQDVEFSIQQLVEIAVRALSPAVNDPFTATQCIDHLTAALCRISKRDFPSPYRYDQDNNLRVIANPVTFANLIDDAFNEIRIYGCSDVAVTKRLLEAIALIASQTRNQKERSVLLDHANVIKSASQEALSQECDRNTIEERYLAAIKVLEK